MTRRLAPRRLLPVLALAAAAAATVLPPVPAVGATPSRYVALGDSYSAGNGTDAKTNACYQSPWAYPVLVAQGAGLALDQRACAGATALDVTNAQLGAVDASAAVVSVSAGGNDAGFAPGLTECALPGWMSNCPAKLDAAQSMINSTIPARLDTLYAGIASRAPQAKRVAVLYPHLFQGTDCNVLTFFSPAEQARINQLTDQLDDAAAGRARARGMTVVDPRGSFTGHAWCDGAEWINGPALPTDDSYHPNRAGNRGYADLVLASLGRPSATLQAAGRTSTSAGRMNAGRWQPTSRQLALVAPGLASPRNLAAAQRAGFSRREVVAIDRDLRSMDPSRQRAALARLHALEQRWERNHRR